MWAQRYEEGNALGSLLAVQDASGSPVGATEYDAYGREVYASGADRGDLRFAGAKGYVNDDATGMRMLGARYYLPALGRFLTQDPIGHDGGLNLYAYCENSPLMRVDPSGHQARDLSNNWFINHRDDPLGAYGRTPHAPSNYTLSTWIEAARAEGNPPFFAELLGAGTFTERNVWFYRLVKPGAPMDFKHYEEDPGAGFHAHYQEIVDYGNFNYGVIGAALGLPTNYLMQAAGAAARHGNGGAGYSKNEYPTYGDQVRDNFFIQMGVQWYQRHNR